MVKVKKLGRGDKTILWEVDLGLPSPGQVQYRLPKFENDYDYCNSIIESCMVLWLVAMEGLKILASPRRVRGFWLSRLWFCGMQGRFPATVRSDRIDLPSEVIGKCQGCLMRHHRLLSVVVVSCPLSDVLGKCQRRWLIVPRPSRGTVASASGGVWRWCRSSRSRWRFIGLDDSQLFFIFSKILLNTFLGSCN